MRPDNAALAEHPDHFSFVRSPGKSAAFLVIGVALLVAMVLCVLNFETLQEIGQDIRGRRSRMLAPYFAHICIGLTGIVGIWAVVRALQTGTWKLANGQALKQQAWVLNGDLDNAHQRLATTDPSVYLPLPVTRGSDNLRRRLRAYTVEGMPTTYLTVTMGSGKNERHWPVLTFEGAAHEAFRQVSSRLGKPYNG